ncbi:MAG: PAS domain-containing sensor histidine kinase [Cytophagaceae bacterium]
MPRITLTPCLIAVIYALIGGFWIFGSDLLLSWYSTDPKVLLGLQTTKGIAYIVITSVLLFLLVKSYSRSVKSSDKIRDESQNKFNKLFQSDIIGLFLWNVDGTISNANNSFLKMVGFTQNHIIQGDFTWSKIIFEEDMDFYRNKLSELQVKKVIPPFEKRFISSDGKSIPVLICFAFLDDEMTKGISIVIDITEQKQTEKKLQQINEQMKAFIYRASHDIKGPLATAIGLNNVAMLEITDEKSLKYFELIKSTMKKLDNNLMKLLRFVEVREKSLELSRIDFETIINQVHKKLEKVPGYTNIDWTTKIRTFKDYFADPGIIYSILYNLLENSIKFRNTYQENSFCKVSVIEAEGEIIINIEDNGMGIHEEIKDRVFELFFRGSTCGAEGSGLGLYIAKNGTERLNGKINLIHKQEGGVIFRIQLPYTLSGENTDSAVFAEQSSALINQLN